ncbi:MAG: hypothetical protein RLY70_4918 [Planctomycetota bacterium]|jgi:putative ABC transport system permease protein
MNWVALRMLVGDRGKYWGLIMGVAFASHLMSQQVSIFVGIIKRTASQIVDVSDAGIWVMDNKVRFVDEAPGLPETDLNRVRGVPGVAWAARLYKGQVRARLEDGNYRNVVMFGLDDANLVGAPRKMLRGQLSDLRRPDAVVIDKAGHEYMWPGEAFREGRELYLNDRRAVLVGICEATPPFTTMPVLYTRYSAAAGFVPRERNLMSFILAEAQPGRDSAEVCQAIEARTGLMALTRDQFFWKTINYFLGSTGIPVNFGITITLGFIIGAAVTGQTFYLFTLENLKQFGALKAMGVTNGRLIGMILLQALVVGVMGYGLGIGLTAAFFTATSGITHLAGLYLTAHAAIGVAIAVLAITGLTALISIRRVLVLEPAIVFRG